MNEPTPQLGAQQAGTSKVLLSGMALAGLLVVIDQVTKMLITRHFSLGESLSIIPGFFNFTFVVNKGAAWGILAGKGWLLLSISMVVLLIIIFRMRSLTEGWTERYLAMFMIISGIIGNSIDRIWHKAVIDFLDFHISGHHWPAFNIADSAITVGVTIYIISVLFRPQTPQPVENPPRPS